MSTKTIMLFVLLCFLVYSAGIAIGVRMYVAELRAEATEETRRLEQQRQKVLGTLAELPSDTK